MYLGFVILSDHNRYAAWLDNLFHYTVFVSLDKLEKQFKKEVTKIRFLFNLNQFT
jgi:hypothetical protein